MAGPTRVQRKRSKGWRMPEGAVYVGRPTQWGNPFPWQGGWIVWTAVALGYTADAAGRRVAATVLHRSWLTGEPLTLGPHAGSRAGGSLEFTNGAVVSMSDHLRGVAATAARLSDDGPTIVERPDLSALRGRDLACWCPPGQPCHADVLLEIANGPSPVVGGGSGGSADGGEQP